MRPGHQNLICYRLFLTSFSFLTMSASVVEILLSRSVLRVRTVASCSLAEVSRGSLEEVFSMLLIPSSKSDTAFRVYKTTKPVTLHCFINFSVQWCSANWFSESNLTWRHFLEENSPTIANAQKFQNARWLRFSLFYIVTLFVCLPVRDQRWVGHSWLPVPWAVCRWH